MPKQGYDGQFGVRGHAVHAPLSRLLLRVDSGGFSPKKIGRPFTGALSAPELGIGDGLDINVGCIEVRFLFNVMI